MNGSLRTAVDGLDRIGSFIFFTLTSVLFISCSSPHETAADRPPVRPYRPTYRTEKSIVPAGWTAVQDAGRFSSADLFLVKNDGGASMILTEMKPAASAKTALSGEDMCVLGNISMQNKLGAGGSDRRILRLPSPIGDGKDFCVYIYSENSLLRRVVVFRAKSKIYELELCQNSESLVMSSVVDAQMSYIKSMMRRDEE